MVNTKITKKNNDIELIGFFEKYYRPHLESLPKYLKLREIILSAVIDGYWRPNDRLPSETELARLTSFSLGTVQKALGKLSDEGVLERLHGHGTFVTKNLVMPLHCRFIDEQLGIVLPTYPKIISRQMFSRQTEWSKKLESDGRNIIEITRILSVGREFNVFNRFYINSVRYKIFMDWPLEKLNGRDLRNLLLYEYNQSVAYTNNMLGIKALTPEALSALGIDDPCIGLHLEATSFSERRQALYHYEMYVPPTQRRLQITNLA